MPRFRKTEVDKDRLLHAGRCIGDEHERAARFPSAARARCALDIRDSLSELDALRGIRVEPSLHVVGAHLAFGVGVQHRGALPLDRRKGARAGDSDRSRTTRSDQAIAFAAFGIRRRRRCSSIDP